MICCALLLLCCGLASSRAVILLGTADPTVNRTAPSGDLAGSGWQFQGDFGSYLGTPIAPKFFITAKHVSSAASIIFESTTHAVVRRHHDAFTDLTICEIGGSFPSFAPLYSASDEIGQHLVVIGRGRERGVALMKDGEPRGWRWGNDTRLRRWGENLVAQIINGGPANQYIYATFEESAAASEAHLAGGDSGGAVFIQENGSWKLAGINYAVDGPFYPGPSTTGKFDAALYDAHGYYVKDGEQFVQITGERPVPSGFYSTRISSKLGWIHSVLDPAGDVNANGVSNLVDYALALNAPPPAGPGAPMVAQEPSFLTLTYRKLVTPNPPVYQVEKSSGLATGWMPITPEEIVQPMGTRDNVQTVKARVPIGPNDNAIFLRVRINPPAG